MKTMLINCPKCTDTLDFSAALREWFAFTEQEKLSNDMSLSIWCETCEDMTVVMAIFPMPDEKDFDTLEKPPVEEDYQRTYLVN